jgi:hypothetical protein
VPLGNAANRKRSSDWFRWNRDGGMYAHLTRLASEKPPPRDWAAAKERFEAALAAERRLARERAAAYTACFSPVDAAMLSDARDAARRAADDDRVAQAGQAVAGESRRTR